MTEIIHFYFASFYIAMMGLGLVLPIERTASGGAAPPVIASGNFPGTLLEGV